MSHILVLMGSPGWEVRVVWHGYDGVMLGSGRVYLEEVVGAGGRGGN